MYHIKEITTATITVTKGTPFGDDYTLVNIPITNGFPTDAVYALRRLVAELYHAKCKVRAIKIVRDQLRCGLKEAKIFVEEAYEDTYGDTYTNVGDR